MSTNKSNIGPVVLEMEKQVGKIIRLCMAIACKVIKTPGFFLFYLKFTYVQ